MIYREIGFRLGESVANVDEETRQSMLTNLRTNREIISACREQEL